MEDWPDLWLSVHSMSEMAYATLMGGEGGSALFSDKWELLCSLIDGGDDNDDDAVNN